MPKSILVSALKADLAARRYPSALVCYTKGGSVFTIDGVELKFDASRNMWIPK